MTTDSASRVEDALALLGRVAAEYSPAVFASSLGAEDMVLTDLIFRADLPIEIFTLDTGRLPEETHALLAAIRDHYGEKNRRGVRVYFPDSAAVEAYVAEYGSNGFYASVAARRACCATRKVEPLRRALTGRRAWVTGLRREQAATRGELEIEAWDADNGLTKFNPLAAWSEAEVWDYIRARGVPYNALHDRHYPSIGCAPCTRAIAVGEPLRAGRWWWEDEQGKECGLHPLSAAPHSSLVKPTADQSKKKEAV